MLHCLVLLGRDYTESNPVRRRPMQKWRTQKPEARLIVVDPRQTEMAKMADMWLQIRPGTDTALLMAWIHVIIARGLYDREFVEQWTYGFEQLKQRAVEYTPERVAEITWIPADQIITSAIAYAGNKPDASTAGWRPISLGAMPRASSKPSFVCTRSQETCGAWRPDWLRRDQDLS